MCRGFIVMWFWVKLSPLWNTLIFVFCWFMFGQINHVFASFPSPPPLLFSSPLIPLCSRGPPPPLPPQPAPEEAFVELTERGASLTHSWAVKETDTPTNLLLFTPLSSPSAPGGPWSVCLPWCAWVCVCVSLCVDECVGVLHHFWWDIERCVCHRVGGWAVGGCAPPPSRCSSSSCSLCPSSPPRLRLLREPSTSPKAVSTPSSTAHITHWKHWKVFVFSFPVNISKPFPQN